jgi:hypothetical protein
MGPAEFELIYIIANPRLDSTSFIRALDLSRRLVILSYADRVVVVRWPNQTLDSSNSSEARLTLSMQSDDLEELVSTQLSIPYLYTTVSYLSTFLTVERRNTRPNRGPVCRDIQIEVYRGISSSFPVLVKPEFHSLSSSYTDPPLSWNNFQGHFLLRRLLFYVVSRRSRPVPESYFLWE